MLQQPMCGRALRSDFGCARRPLCAPRITPLASRVAPPHIAHACLYVYISSISFIFLRAGVQDVKFLNKEQESEAKHFKDPATNIDLDVTDKVWCAAPPAAAALHRVLHASL